MATEPLPAHSVGEAYLYLMVAPCTACHKGPFRAVDAQPDGLAERSALVLDARCAACRTIHMFRFALPAGATAERMSRPADATPRINPTPEPSRIIDVGQWLTLFRVILEAASKAADRAESRRLGYEAAQCLDEALKFYHEDSDLPPEEAFFHEATADRFRSHPELFARQRLLAMRDKLPSLDAMERRLAGEPTRPRSWWRRWRRDR